jgi:sugar phosphate isomerase/epimerase
MHLTRRQMLAAGVGTVFAGHELVRAEPERKRPGIGIVIHSHGLHRAHRPTPDAPDFNDPVVYLDHCVALGAAGVQTRIGVRDAAFLTRLRAQIEKQGLYLEGIVALPRDEDDIRRFETELRCAKDAGATVIRTVTLSTRRYETFATMEAFRAFAQRAGQALQRAEPVAARLGVRLAVENHKDWRIEELLGLLKRLDSAHVGVCLDTGNSIALLEDPLEVVKAYAPWAFTTHFKDMGVAEYADGFLLAEVPLGQGFLALPEMLALLAKAGRGARINLEMITRDPLRVPCLTPKYWATFESLPGRHLAATLALVRARAARRPLAVVSGLPLAAQLQAEEENVRQSLKYAATTLGL